MAGTRSEFDADPAGWIFGDFDRILRRVRSDLGLVAEGYDLFGHSAGGQILHWLALFHPESDANRILAANSGWYTVPTFDEAFPYGLENTGWTAEQLEPALRNRLVVFLGEKDDADETRGSLRRTPAANRQGDHRLGRERHLFAQGEGLAEELEVDLAWTLEVVPGVGHDYQRMSEAAAEHLFGGDG